MTAEPEVCSEIIMEEKGFSHSCSFRVTAHEHGKPWCTIHSPSYVKAKQEKWEAKWQAKGRFRAALDVQRALREHQADLYPELVAALKSVIEEAPWQPLGGEVRAQAKAVLAKCEELEREVAGD